MEFKRRNPAGRSFTADGFKITRPSGPRVTRDGLDFAAAGRSYDVRLDGNEIWLMEEERLVGYAIGDSNEWTLLIDDEPYTINQPKLGNNFSVLSRGTDEVAEITGAGFPVRSAAIETSHALNQEQKAFVVMVALLGWRESDRALLGNVPTERG